MAASIAALADVPDDDSGVASGIEESTFQIGTPLGVAILTTVALSRTDHLLARGTEVLEAQTGGFRYAFGTAAAFAALALVTGLVLLRPGRTDGSEKPAMCAISTAESPRAANASPIS